MAKRQRASTGRKARGAQPPQTASYQHPEASSLLRPEAGTQAQVRKKKPPAQYRYDSSLSPACFKASQVFFPRTVAWDDLKRALKTEYHESVWDHLAGTTSAPFQAGEHGQVAVKVIDDRGNELLVVKGVKEAEG